MRILDIDLDFFLDEIAHFRPFDKRRLNKKHYKPWTSVEVMSFLENRCGLDKSIKLQGKIFTHHDEVFYHVRDLLVNGQLIEKINLVHVDAHADITNGIDSSYMYIMDELLNKPTVMERFYQITDNQYGKLNAGNYIIYMIACQMLESLTFVKHLKTRDKFPLLFYLNNDISSQALQLKSYGHNVISEIVGDFRDLMDSIRNLIPTLTETAIPFNEIFWNNYKEENSFDRIFLTLSPSFTPSTSDELIPIIKQYFEEY